MTRFHDAFSRVKEHFSNFKSVLAGKAQVKRRKYVWKDRFGRWKRYLADNFETYGRTYFKYVLFEFGPNVVAYGLLFNVPGAFFFGFPITAFSVLSFGCGWYILFEETPPVVNTMIPYIKVKVDN